MSRLFTNFEDADIGSNPAGFTRRGDASGNPSGNLFALEYGSPIFKRRQLKLTGITNGSQGGFSVDAADSISADVDMLIAFKYPTGSVPDTIHFYVRGIGTGTITEAYGVELLPSGNLTANFKIVAGVRTYLTIPTFTLAADTWFLIRFQVIGTTVRHRIWNPLTTVEPTTWLASDTDSDVTAAGWQGLGLDDAAGNSILYANFVSVGLAGDASVVPLLNSEYTEWLRAQDAQRCVVAKMKAIGYEAAGVGSPPTFTKDINAYASTVGYLSKPWDDPPNQYFPPIIKRLPTFRREMGANLNGAAPVSFGDMVITNPREADQTNDGPGVRDDWLRARWKRDYIEMLLGDPEEPLHNFRRILFGRLGQPLANAEDEMTFKIGDLSDALNVPLTNSRISNGGSYDGQFYPVLIGQAMYLEPPRIDDATREYRVDEGAISVPSGFTGYVYDNFILDNATSTISAVNIITETITTTAAHGLLENWRVRFGGSLPSPLAANTDYYVIAGGLTTVDFRVSLTLGGAAVDLTTLTTGGSVDGLINYFDLPNGRIYLASAPVGRITSQAIRKNNGTGTEHKIPEMFDYIIHTLAGVSRNFKNQTSFDDLTTDMGSRRAGLWYDTKAHSCKEAADALAAGTNTWYGQTIDGVFEVGRLDLPTGPGIDLTLVEGDIKLESLKMESTMLPVDFTTAQYSVAPHFYTQGPGQGDINPIFFQLKSFLAAYDYGPAGIPLDDHPDFLEAQQTRGYDTIFNSGTAEQTRLAALWLKRSGIWSVQTTLRALQLDDDTPLTLGKVVRLTHSREAWRTWNGAPDDMTSPDNDDRIDSTLAVVVGFDINMSAPDAFKVTLKLWRTIPGYFAAADLN